MLKIQNILWISPPLLSHFSNHHSKKFCEIVLFIDHPHWLYFVILHLCNFDWPLTNPNQVHLLWWWYCHFFVKYTQGFLELFGLIISCKSREKKKREQLGMHLWSLWWLWMPLPLLPCCVVFIPVTLLFNAALKN